MKNPISSLLTRRRKTRRMHRDLRKLVEVGAGGVRSAIYVGGNTVLAPTHFGQWIYLATEDLSVCPRIMTTGTWEAGTTAFFHAHLLDGMNYVDVGANYGYFSLQAGMLVGDHGRVDAFEPLPRAASLIQRTFMANGATMRCHLHESAVCDEEGTATLHGVADLHGGGQLAPHVDLPGREHTSDEVRTTTLDSTLDGRTMEFLKMDAQGAEGLVLKGACETLARSPNIVMVLEMHGAGWNKVGHSATEVLTDLASQGFKFWRIAEPTGHATPATIQELCSDPAAVFDFVVARQVPGTRPGKKSMFRS